MNDEIIYYFKFSSTYPNLRDKYGHGLAISAIQYLEDLNAGRFCDYWTIERTAQRENESIDLDLFISQLRDYYPPG
jgi:hypothetical protein